MVTSSYPRFPGDSVGTFMEPIATSVAARGHEVHVVAPWHPLVTRADEENGVRFHFYKYAPSPRLNVFGYAAALRADVSLKGAAYIVAPLALAAGWRTARAVARQYRATVMHGHWVIPGGVVAAAAAPGLPLVVSLHGSDVYVAETLWAARRAAGLVFRRAGAVTACSADLGRRAIALGADPGRVDVVPYGVDPDRFRPDPFVRARRRASLGIATHTPLLFTAGRLVRKKGFEYLIDALAKMPQEMNVQAAIAGAGDLESELHRRVEAAHIDYRVRFLGNLSQDEVAAWLATADMVAIPSVRDDSGNVDGLPNIVLETMASGTPLITTPAGGIGSVVEHGRTGLVVPERDASALAEGILTLARDPELRVRLGEAARASVMARFGWEFVAERFEAAYDRALAMTLPRR
jgi:glycosyltransferase involved in cell wall biosynthesis